MNIFFEMHQDLPREGPGDSLSTRKAFRKLPNLPDTPRILDVGCGPGAQTFDLAAMSNGEIYAVDTHQPFLDQVAQKAKQSGLGGRIHVSNQSMTALNFPPTTFDLIWSEGAIYIMGFEAGLRAWKPLLKPGGYLAVTEITWMQPNPPAEVHDFWMQDYPGMKDLEENLEIIYACDYHLIDYFALPVSSWMDEYYQPLQARIELLQRKYQQRPEILEQLNGSLKEMEIFSRYNAWYAYVFYILQNKV